MSAQLVRRTALLLLALLVSPARSELDSVANTGLQIAVAGDIVGNFGGTADNRILPREAELMLFSPADYLFNGVLNGAAHFEQGAVFFELHELTFGSSRLIPRSRFRIGQFFLATGRLNQFHRHDWPFTSAPKVQAAFFDPEGVTDTGIEYGYLFPTPFFLDLTVGVTNGWTFGHSHNEGQRPLFPTHFARLATYNALFSNGGVQTGLNYLGRRDGAGTRFTLLGIDLTAKWQRGQVLEFLLQSELWYRIRAPNAGESEKTLGFYVYPQYAVSQTFSVGLRIDGYTVLSLKDAFGAGVSNYEYGLVPTLIYKASEFSTVRLSYNLKGRLSQGRETLPERLVELQAVFILGSHPAHDF